MARSRNIKPGFFTNEIMSECDPLARILFLGLTTIADFRGNLEWRSKRIKVQILPYDDCDIDELGKCLERSGFLRYYSVPGKMYAHIVNFTKHQSPHKNERAGGTEIPEFTEKMSQAVDLKTLATKTDCIETFPEQDESARADSLNPLPKEIPLSTQPVDNSKYLVDDDYQPSDTVKYRIKTSGHTVNPDDPVILEKFRSHHKGRGTVSDDWDSMYVKWCLSEKPDNGGGNGNQRRKTRAEESIEQLQRHARGEG